MPLYVVSSPYEHAKHPLALSRLPGSSEAQTTLRRLESSHTAIQSPILTRLPSFCSLHSSCSRQAARIPPSIRMSSVDHGHESETADAPAEQIAVDGSVASDTDTAARPRSDSLAKDESDFQHHARSNSVKKPTMFKAVSVTKNFLAKAGTPAAPAPKTNGENGAFF